VKLGERARRWLADPRLVRALGSDELARGLVALLEAPGRIGRISAAQTERLARTLGLTTAKELARLERRVEALEAEGRHRH